MNLSMWLVRQLPKADKAATTVTIFDTVERSQTILDSNTLGNELASELLVFYFLGK